MGTLSVALLASSLAVQSAPAPASGRVIEAMNGDVVLVKDGSALRVVRRMDASVRVIYDPSQHWLVVLVDHPSNGKDRDGGVDITYTFNDVTGAWPLGERWQGRMIVDEYSTIGEAVGGGLGLHTEGGLVQLLAGGRGPRDGKAIFQDAAAVTTLSYMGSGRGGGGNESFDVAEQRQTAVAARNAANLPPGTPFRTGIDFRVGTAPDAARPYPPPSAPVRVGGNVRQPARIEDATPILPETAARAGVRGVVIVEIVVGPDGRVTDAKVLRSIPLLDAAALDTVRKWRFEPTLLNGAPVPVIMTVTVNFQ
jgi:TonB family protein